MAALKDNRIWVFFRNVKHTGQENDLILDYGRYTNIEKILPSVINSNMAIWSTGMSVDFNHYSTRIKIGI